MTATLPHKIESQLDGLTPCARAYALAKAAFECAQEASFAEQRAEIKRLTAHDPEPPDPMKQHCSNREKWLAHYELWKAWNERNKEIIYPVADRVNPKHKYDEFEKLYKLAELNMVENAEEKLTKKFGRDRILAGGIDKMFQMYRDNEIYGDHREKFLKICFNCPD